MHPVTTPPAANEADLDEDAVAELFDHHRNHHDGGLTAFIAMSLDTLGPTPDESPLMNSLQNALYGIVKRARDAESGVRKELIDGIVAGNVDRRRVDVAIERLQIAAAGVFEDASDALNRLHAALSKEQRMTLADKVEAHWTVWREANPPDENNRPRGELSAMESTLALTPAQGKDVRARFAEAMRQVAPLDVENVSARIQLFERAFAGDAFDAHTLGQVAVGVELASWGATRMARLCEVLASTTTPEQRTKLADMLREHEIHAEVTIHDP